MTDCNPFKGCDSGVIKEYIKAGSAFMEEPILLKIYLSTTAADPTKGIAKTFVYNIEKYSAIISNIEQNDILYSGGLYQQGDIKVQLRKEIKTIDDKTQSPGDRVIWRGNEYRPVGKTSTSYLGGYVLYDYVMRRV